MNVKPIKRIKIGLILKAPHQVMITNKGVVNEHKV